MIAIALYLFAIVAANLIVTAYGPQASVITAFAFIGLDLVARDRLHDKWHGAHLRRNMLMLIATGSLLSLALNTATLRVGLASFVAFAAAGVVDTAAYQRLFHRHRLIRMNGSNIPAAGIDSILFPLLAFGWPPLIAIMAGQFAAKVFGGALWSLLFNVVRSR